jgi:hypothetical protein
VGTQHSQRTAGRHRRGRGGATACGTFSVGTFNVKRLLHCQNSSGAFSVKDSQSDIAWKVCRASPKEITVWRGLSLLDLPGGRNHLWTPSSTRDALALSLPTPPSLVFLNVRGSFLAHRRSGALLGPSIELVGASFLSWSGHASLGSMLHSHGRW